MRDNAGGEDGGLLANSAYLRLGHAEEDAVFLLFDSGIRFKRGGRSPAQGRRNSQLPSFLLGFGELFEELEVGGPPRGLRCVHIADVEPAFLVVLALDPDIRADLGAVVGDLADYLCIEGQVGSGWSRDFPQEKQS